MRTFDLQAFDLQALDIPTLDWLATQPLALLLVVLALGLCVGSFLNVVVYRLPLMMEKQWRESCAPLLQPLAEQPVTPEQSLTTAGDTEDTNTSSHSAFNLMWPASHCPQCQQPIAGYDNIPVLSFLLLKGHCRHCQSTIGWRYPLVELATGLLSAALAWHIGPNWPVLLALLFLLWALIALTLIDLDHMLLPDDITLPLLWAGLLLNITDLFSPLQDAVIGAALGYALLWTVYWLFKALTGKEGMGYGDFKLLAALGAWGGWMIIPDVLLLACLLGIAASGLLMLAGKDGRKIPFGPALAVAGFITLAGHFSISHLLLF